MTMMTTTPSLAFSFPPHVYILPGECQRDLKSHDQNDHDICRHLNDNLVYVNVLTLVDIQFSLHLYTLVDIREGGWALGKAGNRGQGLLKLFFIF
jgi:hypothetical protein